MLGTCYQPVVDGLVWHRVVYMNERDRSSRKGQGAFYTDSEAASVISSRDDSYEHRIFIMDRPQRHGRYLAIRLIQIAGPDPSCGIQWYSSSFCEALSWCTARQLHHGPTTVPKQKLTMLRNVLNTFQTQMLAPNDSIPR